MSKPDYLQQGNYIINTRHAGQKYLILGSVFSINQLLQIEGVAWSAQRIPTAVNLSFQERNRYFFIQVAPQLSSRG
jgi:hypothetical protein